MGRIIYPQERFDYLLEDLNKILFPGLDYANLKAKIERGDEIPIIDRASDKKLMDEYVNRHRISRSLLESLVDKTRVNAVLDENGRRTIVLSQYSPDYIDTVGGTGKKVIVDLLNLKLNGTGAHIVNDAPGEYQKHSLVSLLESSPGYGFDEGVFVYLSSDHVPVRELKRPRALNILFSNIPDSKTAQSSIRALTPQEFSSLGLNLARHETYRNIFRTSIGS